MEHGGLGGGPGDAVVVMNEAEAVLEHVGNEACQAR